MRPFEILQDLGVDIISPSTGSTGYAWFKCPECGKPTAKMFQDRWPFHVRCFSGGGHLSTTLPGLYAKIKRIPYRTAAEDVARRLRISIPLSQKPRQKQPKEEIKTTAIPPGWRPVDMDKDEDHAKWLTGRGFDPSWVERMNVLMHDHYVEWVMFPVQENGKTVSYEKRCIVKKDDWDHEFPYIKTMAPKDIQNNQFIYGLDLIKPRSMVVLCEGIPNWYSLIQAGFNPGGTFGSNLSERQLQLILDLEPTSVVYALDGDSAGFDAISKIRPYLSSMMPNIDTGLWMIPGGKDINDIHDPDLLWQSFGRRDMETLLALSLTPKKKQVKKNAFIRHS